MHQTSLLRKLSDRLHLQSLESRQLLSLRRCIEGPPQRRIQQPKRVQGQPLIKTISEDGTQGHRKSAPSLRIRAPIWAQANQRRPKCINLLVINGARDGEPTRPLI